MQQALVHQVYDMYTVHSQRLELAEGSYIQALRYDPQYQDAMDELVKVRVEQLKVCVCVCVCVSAFMILPSLSGYGLLPRVV